MTTFTANDVIFKPLKDASGLDPAALQNLVNALNRNPYGNATLTAAAQRSDVVFELVRHEDLKGDGAQFSNDRGTRAFEDRQSKFAIQLDQDWFVPRSTPEGIVPATFAQPQSVLSALGIVIHEVDHSNRQPLYDEAYKLSATGPDAYRPDLTGAARVAASVDLTMKAEVSGWYADLNTLRAEVAGGHVSAGQYNAYTREGTINAKLIAIEQQGKAQGLSGNALTEYIADHGKEAIPVSYATRYTDAYAPPGVDKIEVRGILAYALDHPGQVKDFAEEVGPDGTYLTSATYNNGERITTIYDGSGGHIETKETLQPGGAYWTAETRAVRSYNADGSYGDETTTHYYADGRIYRITDSDGAHNNADYSTRTTTYDAQGRVDSVDVRSDDGARDWTDYDQNNAQGWSRVESHFDAQGREDYATVTADDGSRTIHDYDQTSVRADSTWQTHIDAQGRTDWTYVTQDDGSHDWTDYDQTNARGDSIWQSHTDAQGREDWTYVTQDDGSHNWTDYDQTNVRGDSIWQSRTDAQGREDWRYVTQDDGGHEWTDFDQTNVRGDSIWQNRTDAWGREDWANVTLDDGSRNWYDYDQNGSQGWNRVESHFDAWGREDNASMFLDDGSRNWYDYDQDGSQGWNRVESHFDAWGREAHASMYLDDGSRDWYDYDQDGSQGWSRVVSHYDASGREDYATMFLDDGSRNTYDYDQDGLQRWSRMESHFGANGRAEYSTTYNDDGSRLVIDHDYNGHLGEHGIITYSAAGRARLVGWTKDGYDGLIFTPGGSVIGSNGNVSGPPPSFGQFPTALPYLPAIYSDADGDGPSWTIETPWGVYHGT